MLNDENSNNTNHLNDENKSEDVIKRETDEMTVMGKNTEENINNQEIGEDIKVNAKNSTFLCDLKKGILDTVFTVALSGILMGIFDIILRYIFGYYISDITGMLLIFFVIASVFYPSLKNKYKLKRAEK